MSLAPWNPPNPPEPVYRTGLFIYNSLTRQKNEFITMNGSKWIRWYMCGPTVYAPSHMGHARTYLSFDIIRRILQDYFGYQVCLIMNVTDLDDKIIERSREQGLSSHLQLSQQYEQEFHEDMTRLNVMAPTIVTRVTDYMEEIIQYIQVIIDKGLAYESHGSVYFDVQAFEQHPDMHYCKLAPEQIHNAALLAEGEGKLTTQQDFVLQKKSPRDFALWKASKPGEPEWASPWKPGRPGWHIECSVMASDVLQTLFQNVNQMDIHSGGVDLKFPHHDNEMAQAEAYNCTSNQNTNNDNVVVEDDDNHDCHHTHGNNNHPWVNYFVHSGHLEIKGFKMSKSLKNFITIRQALEDHTSRQIRFLFLLHKYNVTMDYGDHTMSHALVTEKLFVEFFHNIKAVLRQHHNNTSQPQSYNYQFPKWTPAAFSLQRALQDTQDKVDLALKDDFDTPTAMQALIDLVKATNSYLQQQQQQQQSVVILVITNVARYITRMFQVFGLVAANNNNNFGFGSVDDGGEDGSSSASREQILTPVLDALVQFRSQVRDLARDQNVKGVLGACDTFRDDVLPDLGVRLEDVTTSTNTSSTTTTTTSSIWKLALPEEMQRERQQRQLEAQRKQQEKEKAEADRLQKEAMNRLTPAEFMKSITIEVEEEEEEEEPKDEEVAATAEASTTEPESSAATSSSKLPPPPTRKKVVVIVPKYSQFDDTTGMPTHMYNGEPLNKNQMKKAQKEFQGQEKKYEKYLATTTLQQDGAGGAAKQKDDEN